MDAKGAGLVIGENRVTVKDSSSWVVTRKADGVVIGEFFERSNVERFDPEKCLIETIEDYLCRINAAPVIGDWVKFRIPHATQKDGTKRAGQIKEIMQTLGNVVIKAQDGSYYTVAARLLNSDGKNSWTIAEVIR